MADSKFFDIGSIGGDEYYTLPSVAKQIVDNMIHIPHLRVWCPFADNEHPAIRDALTNAGFEAICTDTDFFTTDPPNGCGVIVSNPPFSLKDKVLKRTKELGMRFVYILPFIWLNDTIPMEYGHQLMLFRHRMHFTQSGGGKK